MLKLRLGINLYQVQFQAQKSYANYRAEKDPARGMLTRLYGAEWTEEYIHGFLFDLERHLQTA